MPFPEIQAVHFFFIKEHLDVANEHSLDMVYIRLVAFLPVAREKPWSFGRWLLLIGFTTALRYGDFPSLSYDEF